MRAPLGSYRTLKQALAVVRGGVVVLVGPGTYYEHGVRIEPLVRVQSTRGLAQTIINGGGIGPVVVLSGEGAVLDGLTVKGGRTIGNGGGVRIHRGGEIVNCIVQGNRAGGYGGGVTWNTKAQCRIVCVKEMSQITVEVGSFALTVEQ